MGGFSFETARGPFATIEYTTRTLVLEALAAADTKLVVRGDFCPDCLHTNATRASLLLSLKSARTYVETHPRFFSKHRILWQSGRSTRDVFFSMVDYLLEELESVPDAVVLLTEDYYLCGHPRMGAEKAKPGGWALRHAKELKR